MTEQNISTTEKLAEFIDSAHRLSEASISDIEELEAIFKAIKVLSDEYTDIRRLASAGEHLAMDKANAIDCWREQIFEEYRKESAA